MNAAEAAVLLQREADIHADTARRLYDPTTKLNEQRRSAALYAAAREAAANYDQTLPKWFSLRSGFGDWTLGLVREFGSRER